MPHTSNAQFPVSDERRRGDRRRRYRALIDWRWARGGRRRSTRRGGDATVLLDWYRPELLAVGVAILVLSAVDAMFTSTLIESGAATEANPVASLFMDHGFELYVNVKMAVAAVAVIWMVAFSRLRLFGRVTIGALMYLLLGVYVLLAGYETTLLLSHFL